MDPPTVGDVHLAERCAQRHRPNLRRGGGGFADVLHVIVVGVGEGGDRVGARQRRPRVGEAALSARVSRAGAGRVDRACHGEANDYVGHGVHSHVFDCRGHGVLGVDVVRCRERAQRERRRRARERGRSVRSRREEQRVRCRGPSRPESERIRGRAAPPVDDVAVTAQSRAIGQWVSDVPGRTADGVVERRVEGGRPATVGKLRRRGRLRDEGRRPIHGAEDLVGRRCRVGVVVDDLVEGEVGRRELRLEMQHGAIGTLSLECRPVIESDLEVPEIPNAHRDRTHSLIRDRRRDRHVRVGQRGAVDVHVLDDQQLVGRSGRTGQGIGGPDTRRTEQGHGRERT